MITAQIESSNRPTTATFILTFLRSVEDLGITLTITTDVISQKTIIRKIALEPY